MVATSSMVRLISRAAFLGKWGGVSSIVRLDSRPPFISNVRSILPYRGMRITQMGYLWCFLNVTCGSELFRALYSRRSTSENGTSSTTSLG
jgi:hypothetical protein